eukprot:COSAG02_NODE_4517_length_5272_cov_2.579354_4_plen_229_part_00
MQVVGPSCGLAPAGLVVPLGHGVHTPSAVTCSSALQVRVPVHGGVPPFIQLRKNWQLPSGQSGGSFGSNGTSGDGVGALEWDRVPVLFIVICAVVTPRPAASTSGYIIMTRVVEDGLVLCGVPRSCSVVGCLSSCEAERPSQLHRPKKAFRRRPVRFDFHQPTDFHCVSRYHACGGAPVVESGVPPPLHVRLLTCIDSVCRITILPVERITNYEIYWNAPVCSGTTIL